MAMTIKKPIDMNVMEGYEDIAIVQLLKETARAEDAEAHFANTNPQTAYHARRAYRFLKAANIVEKALGIEARRKIKTIMPYEKRVKV